MILIAAAHPDDEVIGAGATIAKLAKKEKVTSLIFSQGEKFPFWMDKEEIIRVREKESLKADKILGVSKTIFLRMKDGEVEKEIKKRKKELLDIVKKINPSKIFFHSSKDLHKDHLAVNKFILYAVKKLNLKAKLFAYEVSFWDIFAELKPFTYFDVSLTFAKKIKALEQFKSQSIIISMLKPLIKAKAIYYGKKFNCKFAEIFYRR